MFQDLSQPIKQTDSHVCEYLSKDKDKQYIYTEVLDTSKVG